jgi:hypothetical protein
MSHTTFLHFAESRVPYGCRKTRRIPTDRDGVRSWLVAPDVGDDLNTYFRWIGDEFVIVRHASVGFVGQAKHPCLITLPNSSALQASAAGPHVWSGRASQQGFLTAPMRAKA